MASALALLAALALATLAAGAAAARADGAFLILSRRISGDLVQGTNFTVDYEIYNVGAAYVPRAPRAPRPQLRPARPTD